MPQTITKTYEVYTFDELDDDAKDKAHQDYLCTGYYWSRHREWWDSAHAFSRIAPMSIIRADVAMGHVDCSWDGGDQWEYGDVRNLEGIRAWKWLNNNGWFKWAREEAKGKCSMTGYCEDAPFGDAFLEYENNPARTPTLEQVFCEAFQAWVYEARSDLEYHETLEHFEEMAEINEWRFYADGSFY
jgi:hypothetical protein